MCQPYTHTYSVIHTYTYILVGACLQEKSASHTRVKQRNTVTFFLRSIFKRHLLQRTFVFRTEAKIFCRRNGCRRKFSVVLSQLQSMLGWWNCGCDYVVYYLPQRRFEKIFRIERFIIDKRNGTYESGTKRNRVPNHI